MTAIASQPDVEAEEEETPAPEAGSTALTSVANPRRVRWSTGR